MRWITKVESGKARSRKRAAVYCQVSTDKEDQLDSLQNQMKSFQLRIQQNKDWNLVNIYTDEGISGTSIRHRVQFLEMIDGVPIYCVTTVRLEPSRRG